MVVEVVVVTALVEDGVVGVPAVDELVRPLPSLQLALPMSTATSIATCHIEMLCPSTFFHFPTNAEPRSIDTAGSPSDREVIRTQINLHSIPITTETQQSEPLVFGQSPRSHQV